MFRRRATAKVELVGGPNDGDIADAEIADDNSLMPVVIVRDRYVFWRYRFGRPPQFSFEGLDVAQLAPPVAVKKRRRRRKKADDAEG